MHAVKRTSIFAALLVVFAATSISAESYFIDNGVLHVGVDSSRGGSITYLSQSNVNYDVINSHDQGREVQQSYYSGPDPYLGGEWSGNPWPWNPIGAGDQYLHSGTVMKVVQTETSLYVESRPLQWALNNVQCNCTFETNITLDGTAVVVNNRLTNFRYDKTVYQPYTQELPAVYTIGELYRLVTYNGSEPWTNAEVNYVNYPVPGPPWTSWTATEGWAALMRDVDYGLGVMNKQATMFSGGFHGKQGTGGASDDNTGYISPNAQAQLTADIVYEYEYTLILGTLDTIRGYVYQHHTQEQEQKQEKQKQKENKDGNDLSENEKKVKQVREGGGEVTVLQYDLRLPVHRQDFTCRSSSPATTISSSSCEHRANGILLKTNDNLNVRVILDAPIRFWHAKDMPAVCFGLEASATSVLRVELHSFDRTATCIEQHPIVTNDDRTPHLANCLRAEPSLSVPLRVSKGAHTYRVELAQESEYQGSFVSVSLSLEGEGEVLVRSVYSC